MSTLGHLRPDYDVIERNCGGTHIYWWFTIMAHKLTLYYDNYASIRWNGSRLFHEMKQLVQHGIDFSKKKKKKSKQAKLLEKSSVSQSFSFFHF